MQPQLNMPAVGVRFDVMLNMFSECHLRSVERVNLVRGIYHKIRASGNAGPEPIANN
jgi:hypothetical protein